MCITYIISGHGVIWNVDWYIWIMDYIRDFGYVMCYAYNYTLEIIFGWLLIN